MKNLLCAFATTTVALLAGHVQAQTQTASAVMPISATVLSACVVSATPLVFGNYNATSATDTTGSATVSLICSGTATASIELDNGLYPSATTRRMAFGTQRLSYGLFKPLTAVPGAACGALTVPFGTGVGASLPLTGLTIAAQVFNVCGNIPTGQSAALGAYSDVVTVNVTF